MKAVLNFDAEKFFSTKTSWYEMEKNENNIGTSDCALEIRMVNAPGSKKIFFSFNYQDSKDYLDFTGTINKADSNNTYVSVQFPPDPSNSTLLVLDTDYDNYALVYSCSPEGKERIWILTENKTDEAIQTLIQDAIKKQGENFQNKLLAMDTCEEIHKLDPCLYKTNKADLDLTRLAEKSWFEQLRSSNDWEANEVCAVVNFTYEADKEKITVSYESLGIHVKYLAFTVFRNDTNLSFDSTNDNFFYFITDTDYENYAVIYSCDQVSKSEKKERLWILGKYNKISKEIIEAVSNEFKDISVENITCPPPAPTTTDAATEETTTASPTTENSSKDDEGETTTSAEETTSSPDDDDNGDNKPPPNKVPGYDGWNFYYLFQLKNE